VGPYRLEVSANGFKTHIQSGIVLEVNNDAMLNVALQVGAISQNVEVYANATMVQTRSSSVSQVIGQQRVTQLPLNGRDPIQLIMLSGAAVLNNYGDFHSSKNYPRSEAISIAGGQGQGTAYLMDGGTHMDLFGGINLPLPFPDALREFSVQTSTMSAQYGGSAGGVVNVVTKSGTNQIHGDLFEFLRNGATSARNFFAAKRDTLKRNQFGGTIGGPIVKDKLFYFAGYQGSRIRTAPPTNTNFLPTAAALAGDFSTLDSSVCGQARNLIDPTTGQLFPNNFIDPSRFNSSALKMVNSYIPVPADPCGKALFAIPNPQDEDQVIGRMDWNTSTRNNLFGRYYITDFRNPAVFDGNLILTNRAGVMDRVQSAVFGDTYSFSPNLLNSLHFTWARDRVNRGPAPGLPSADSIGLNIAPSPGNFPNISVSSHFSTLCGTCSHAYVHSNLSQVADDISWVHGRHEMAFGMNYMRGQMDYHFTTLQNSIYGFDGSFTGDPLADFLLGLPDGFDQGNLNPYFARENFVSVYAQDTFRATSNITLIAGLRWEPYFPAYDIHNEATHFDPSAFAAGQHSRVFLNAPPGMFFPGDTLPGGGALPRSGTHGHLADFSPRVGIAWSPGGSGNLSVRASYGIFYDLPTMGTFDRYGINPPWGDRIHISGPVGGFSDPYLGYPGGNPFPLPTTPPSDVFIPSEGTYITLPLYINPPYTQSWNFSIERQFGKDWLFDATYMGNKSTHRWLNQEWNPAVYIPGQCGNAACSTVGNTNQRRVLYLQDPVGGSLISSLTHLDDGGNAGYNALYLSANHRISQNYSILANYTWSHCISEKYNDHEIVGSSYQNPYDRNADRGNCIVDVRQLFNLSFLATVPRLRNGLADRLLGGWGIGGIISARTGFWFSASSGKDASLTAVGDDRPDIVGNPVLNDPTLREWFNTSAFRINSPGTYGNAGSFNLLGPGSFSFDAQLTRRFTIREGQQLEVRVEAFNVLNHPNFNNPSGTITSSNFGRILSAGDPRIWQFAMKYIF
jgi:hypothetical protein